MFDLLLLTALLTAICFAAKAYLAYLDYKEGIPVNLHPGDYFPPISREQRN